MIENGEVSLKKNFAYKSALTLSNYLIAFITFPYISRVLGVANIGLINFVDNTINYFVLFASMGVNVIGIREIARTAKDRIERSNVFCNILAVNLLFTITTLFIYYLSISLTPKFAEHSELFYIGSAKLLFSAFLIEWFYTGLENFRYITIRTIVIKAAYLVSVFLFVKSAEDYKLYFYLTLATTIINALINIVYSRKFIDMNFKELLNFKYLKDNIKLGVYSIMTSMYLTFNVMYLGLVSNDVQVGYYTTAFKLYSVILGFFTAFTNVMLPRMSSLIAANEQERFQNLLNKSFSVMVTFSIPLIICCEILAPELIFALSGPGYEGAIIPMRIIMPAVIFVGIAQVIAIQILMPLHKDKVLLNTSVIGAFVSIILNFFLVKHLQSVGSAIVLLSCECIVTISYILFIIRKSCFHFPWIKIAESLIISTPCILICYLCKFCISNQFLKLIIACAISIIIWSLCIYLKRLIERERQL